MNQRMTQWAVGECPPMYSNDPAWRVTAPTDGGGARIDRRHAGGRFYRCSRCCPGPRRWFRWDRWACDGASGAAFPCSRWRRASLRVGRWRCCWSWRCRRCPGYGEDIPVGSGGCSSRSGATGGGRSSFVQVQAWSSPPLVRARRFGGALVRVARLKLTCPVLQAAGRGSLTEHAVETSAGESCAAQG